MSSANASTTISGRLRLGQADEPLERTAAGVVPFRGGETTVEEELPTRYEVRRRDGHCELLCDEAPGVAVTLERDYAFSEADARKLGERVILLDGAGQFAPLIDDACHLYNLDHHRDCLRAFTLATCEQALILVQKGLRLDKGNWTLYANEPDLDTLFAIWVLLNYRRIRDLPADRRDAIVPLIRLEGAIDANGYEIAEFCGLPQERLHQEKERLDALHRLELEVKQSGDWATMDLAEYARDMLLAIDRYVYEPSDFHDYASVEEVYGHVDVGPEHVAVVCRDGAGIYEVERRLKKTWGDRLGIVALEKNSGHYTLRRTASFAGIQLDEAYDKLNLLDPQVDGRPPEKRWGGSDEIGGSPRPTGTTLTPREIGNILKLAYQSVSRWQHLQRFSVAALWTTALVLIALVAIFAWRRFVAAPDTVVEQIQELALGSGLLGLGAWFLTRKLSSGWTWLFGWRKPTGNDGWLLALPALVAGAVGASWVPLGAAADPAQAALGGAAVLIAALSMGLAFPGLVHGLLVLDAPVQAPGGRWFVSRPALAAGFLSGLITVAATWLCIAPSPLDTGSQLANQALLFALAWFAGVLVAMARERSLSLWPGTLALALGGLARWLWML